MKHRLFTGTTVSCAVAFALGVAGQLGLVGHRFSGAALAAAAEHAECSHMTMLKIPGVAVTEAVAVPAATTGLIRAAHCRVNGVIEKDIKFSLLLPDEWNHKFVMGGGGGFVGSIDNQARMSVNAGYATVGTDTGHTGGVTDAKWALNDHDRVVNFAYAAVHRVAEVSKTIVRSYYNGNETRSYFSGCSNGGRQALMEAQRYPDDFDGIVAGAPAYDFTGVAAQFLKDIRAQFPDPANLTPILPPDVLQTVSKQIVEQCDALDGVKDGVLEDPRQCKLDVASLTGLTAAQQTALKAIYAPTVIGKETVYPAQPFGGEGEAAGWPAWISGAVRNGTPATPARYAFGTELFKYMVFNNAEWDYRRYDNSTFRSDTKKLAEILNATSTDLGPFQSKGHKLILWHGWSDTALSALGSIKYYDQLQKRDSKASAYARMFLMPGVLHCAGGAGPDTVDWTSAIDAWVDKGVAPERIVAEKRAQGAVVRSRPLCAYPQKAVYSGNGSTDAAENFSCK